jgi:16S rRNA (cytidine1402-2'-O)-methyltransferase
MGVLFVVATPIGNLEDITLRALRILRQVQIVAAEDTRTTAKLLAHYDIHTPMVSFFEHNELVRQDEILQALETQDVALVSEAGMPTISDPGYRLVRAAISSGFLVVPVPGASAILAAVAVSGLATDSFLFLGFLPRRAMARRRLLASVRAESRTIICFEAPHRLLRALEDILQTLGDREVAVACELTKMYENVWRGLVSAAVVHSQTEAPRGEYTLVLAGAPEAPQERWEEQRVRQALSQLLADGFSRRDAAVEVCEMSNWPKREVYRLAVEQAINAGTRRRDA